ncbi:HD-GYP domain-containing protein [Parasporobacterium paucivorans]|uniref:HDIG domain-containing protein n=1 Tax=Parasporobacterium paucivorans DSM 15970 TaxID=1122934 RepID=A0A1M6I7A0_9FIRM|nr:HD-GYP domain-containing protein [Parasporobacterium paucivorans]SHJ30275.1 HDIG domain-containing protein [Parasporobacterium paucivorans DSM 15970]
MRKVPLNKLKPDMYLARPVFYKNMLMLNRGVHNLDKYIRTLRNMGVSSLYVEDGLSEGIEVTELLSEKTIHKCRNILHNIFDNFRKTGNVDSTNLLHSSNIILDELISREDVLVSLDSIGTTDANTLSHSLNVAIYSLILGTQLGLSRERLLLLSESAMLHDIGKTVLDQDILFKPGQLSETEFNYVKSHTVLGYDILKENPVMSAITRNVALYHHERLDGSGYPEGILDDGIHNFARIVAIADIYDALTMDRCYRKAVSASEAVSILLQDAGTKLDTSLVDIFITQLAIYPNGTLVRLSDGRSGIVSSQNSSLPFQPVIRILQEAGETETEPYEVNLAQETDVTILDEMAEL